mgnify:CR=1 FL=1
MANNELRYAFFGTPLVGVWVLEELAAAGMLPSVVVSAPDRPQGRGMRLQAPPVKEWAIAHSIPVLQPEKLNQEFIDEVSEYGCEVFLVAAYGKILKQRILDLPAHGCLNVHPSLLPKYRGAAPIEGQILADDSDVGVSFMLMDAEMDHGPILAQDRIAPPHWPLGRDALSELLARAGGRTAARLMPEWVKGTVSPVEQDHTLATFTRKTEKEDGLIDPDGPARENYLKYCAYEGWPGLYFYT